MELQAIEETYMDTQEETSISIVEETDMHNGPASGPQRISVISHDEEQRTNFYVQKIKLAVAIAIIRSTPPKMTPETYSSLLVQHCREDTNKWKDKCEALERKLIAMEEKLETVELRNKFNIPDKDMDSLLNDKPTPYVTKPRIQTSSDLRLKICNTIEFVRSFIFLGSVIQDGIGKNEADSREQLGGKILRSISLLFEYLRTSEGLEMEFEIIKCTMDEVRRLFDSKVNFFEKSLVEKTMSFVDNLLLDIYKTLQINTVDQQHRRSMLIQMLAEQKKLTHLILSRLLREITILSDSLVTALNSPTEDLAPLLRLENAYFVLQATEGTLHAMRQQQSTLNIFRIPQNYFAEWSKTTEKSLLDIGSRFPMYSIYVWQIKSLLKQVLESDIET